MDTARKVIIDRPELVRGRKVLVVEDGPSVTHGGLPAAGGARGEALRRDTR